MILKKLLLNTGFGEATNCYIVADEDTKEALIIDPGGEAEKIIEMIQILQVKVKYIIITHCHGDHIGALPEIKKITEAKILVHRDDAEGLCKDEISLSSYIGLINPRGRSRCKTK